MGMLLTLEQGSERISLEVGSTDEELLVVQVWCNAACRREAQRVAGGIIVVGLHNAAGGIQQKLGAAMRIGNQIIGARIGCARCVVL